MVAEIRKRRSKTARELAEKYGITIRQVQNIIAEPREDFLKRAAEKRQEIFKLRVQGLKIKDISAQTGIPYATVGAYISQAKKDGTLEQKIIWHTSPKTNPKKVSKPSPKANC